MNEELKNKVIGALIGLVKSCESHEPLPTTTPLIIEGLLVTGPADIYDREKLQALVSRVHEEKYTIVPGCKVCASPCGNTSDYDLEKLRSLSPEKQEASQRLLKALHRKAARIPADTTDMETALILYRGLAALSLDWEAEEIDELIAEF